MQTSYTNITTMIKTKTPNIRAGIKSNLYAFNIIAKIPYTKIIGADTELQAVDIFSELYPGLKFSNVKPY